MQYLLERLQERSTWVGLIAIGTAVGAKLSPEDVENVIHLGTILSGAMLAFTKDKDTSK